MFEKNPVSHDQRIQFQNKDWAYQILKLLPRAQEVVSLNNETQRGEIVRIELSWEYLGQNHFLTVGKDPNKQDAHFLVDYSVNQDGKVRRAYKTDRVVDISINKPRNTISFGEITTMVYMIDTRGI